jgi:hypothetical protein
MKISTRVLVATALASWLIIQAAPPAAAYNRYLTRTSAHAYAIAGVHERYTWGGGKFINNNRWDPGCAYVNGAGTQWVPCNSAREGIDCSGFASKVYAIPNTTSQTSYDHPYGTSHFYPTLPGQRGRLPNGTRTQWVGESTAYVPGSNPYWMEIFVYPGHMGLFWTRNSDGTWKTYEAVGKTTGVVVSKRSLSALKDKGWRNIDRLHWAGKSWYCDQHSDC